MPPLATFWSSKNRGRSTMESESFIMVSSFDNVLHIRHHDAAGLLVDS
jgi:hypothetical protein